jgi:CHAD domain-containing protein
MMFAKGTPEVLMAGPTQSRFVSKPQKTGGLRYWMERVLEECDRARTDFAADPVHDLRVAMRRCRSLADGLMMIDPSKSWKAMKKSARPLFQALGELRDTQIMEDVVREFGDVEDPVVQCVLDYGKAREHELKSTALVALDDFDTKAWRGWSKELPRRAARIRQGSIVFRHIALERWTEARKLQAPALRTRSQLGLHRLRIGLKRFRYTVENFLPDLHDAWMGDLKGLQDILGEVHDLDVLWAKMMQLHAFPDPDTSLRWGSMVTEARNKRIEKYRQKMEGPDSLWKVWRAELPKGAEVRSAGLERLRLWASFLDPDTVHSRHVARLASKIYNGLESHHLIGSEKPDASGEILRAAALMHDVEKDKSNKSHPKKSYKKIAGLQPPLGWSAEDLTLAAAVARYHRGALPQNTHKVLSGLSPDRRKKVVQMAAVLRLADAFDCDGKHVVPDVEVQAQDGVLRINAKGYLPRSKMAQHLASARYLLELVCNRPVLIRPWK